MKILLNPDKESWIKASQRPLMQQDELEIKIKTLLNDIRDGGDAVLKELTRKFDKAEIDELQVSNEEINAAEKLVPEDLKNAIRQAKKNIEVFHESQKMDSNPVKTFEGVICWQKQVPIERVGLYIPGGTAPLFSTMLMLAVPAKIAGCKKIIACTPPNQSGEIHPAILFTARLCGIEAVCKLGGAQAVAAMAYGTETVPAVDKIFGPGNQFVTMAKQIVARGGVAIDMVAGPSEVAVLADENANPVFLASDLLSQAEHGTDSQSILITNSQDIMDNVGAEVEKQLAGTPRQEIAAQSIANSMLVKVENLNAGMELINLYAPEHFIINTKDPEKYAAMTENAGSVFIGAYTPESAGDYASGTNHTLPTNGYARNSSGLVLGSFMKTITFQKISDQGLKKLGPIIETMAAAEELDGHKMAVTRRLKSLLES